LLPEVVTALLLIEDDVSWVSSSAALDKASFLSKKITQRSNENRKVFTLETDSESLETPRQITPQPDSDSFKIGKNSAKFLKKKQPPAEPDIVTNRPASPKQNVKKCLSISNGCLKIIKN
jgi:hypothetical protein